VTDITADSRPTTGLLPTKKSVCRSISIGEREKKKILYKNQSLIWFCRWFVGRWSVDTLPTANLRSSLS